MADITVTVTGTPPTGSYASDSKLVTPEGTITISTATTIVFLAGSGQDWEFESPWINFSPQGGPFTLEIGAAGQITVLDSDPNARGVETSFNYSLVTSKGDFDPQIINKG